MIVVIVCAVLGAMYFPKDGRMFSIRRAWKTAIGISIGVAVGILLAGVIGILLPREWRLHNTRQLECLSKSDHRGCPYVIVTAGTLKDPQSLIYRPKGKGTVRVSGKALVWYFRLSEHRANGLEEVVTQAFVRPWHRWIASDWLYATFYDDVHYLHVPQGSILCVPPKARPLAAMPWSFASRPRHFLSAQQDSNLRPSP